VLGQRQDDGRDQERPVDPMLLHGLQERLEVELRHRDHGAALVQRRVQQHDHPVDVEERKNADHPIALPDQIEGGDLAEVRHEVVVGEHHALRQPGGPAGIGKDGEVPSRVDVHRRRLAPRPQQVGERRGALGLPEHEHLVDPGLLRGLRGAVQEGRHRQQVPGAGVLELEDDLIRGVQRVDRADDAADRDHPVKRHGEFRHVRAEHAEHLSLGEATLREARADPSDAVGELRVGQRPPTRPVDQRRPVGMRIGPLQHELRERHLRDVDVGMRAAVDHRLPPSG
jgi:hypothetical protein